jgi:PTS system mannose-specific IIC component
MTELGLITAASLIVALLSLDHTAVAQVMVSQPLVGGWILGSVLGRPLEGLAAGALFQILCLTELPVGASIPPDGSLAGLIGTALYLTVPRPPGWSDGAILGAVVLLFFPLARLGRSLEVVIRRSNRHWTAIAVRRAGEGRYGLLQLASLGGLPLFFSKAFLVSWVVLWAGSFGGALPASFAPLAPPLALLGRAVPFFALGTVAARYGKRRRAAAAAAGFALGFLITLGRG